jgi:hypothetical protein
LNKLGLESRTIGKSIPLILLFIQNKAGQEGNATGFSQELFSGFSPFPLSQPSVPAFREKAQLDFHLGEFKSPPSPPIKV